MAEQRPKTWTPLHGQYAMTLDAPEADVELQIDAKHVGNESRFINDFRGVAPRPNVAFVTTADVTKGLWVDVQVIEPISAGDEIVVDYGDSFSRLQRTRHG